MQADIYTKPNCVPCARAKVLLRGRGVLYAEFSASEDYAAMAQRVAEAGGPPPRTAPQIFLDGVYIGGYDQLVAHYQAQAARSS